MTPEDIVRRLAAEYAPALDSGTGYDECPSWWCAHCCTLIPSYRGERPDDDDMSIHEADCLKRIAVEWVEANPAPDPDPLTAEDIESYADDFTGPTGRGWLTSGVWSIGRAMLGHVTVRETPDVPAEGDVITLDGRRFRVVSVNGEFPFQTMTLSPMED